MFRVAVLCPKPYLSGNLKEAILLANAIAYGSQLAQQPCEVIFYYVDLPCDYESSFEELELGIQSRTFQWDTLDAEEAERAMLYAGIENWKAQYSDYIVPDDGMKNAYDCDI